MISEMHFYQLFIATVLGALIGLEREMAGKDPSLRTFALISLGSCLFAILSKHSVIGFAAGDPSRIAAQVASGIGFLGAGAIFRSPRGVSGLTTAAFMWVTASIGLAVGFEQMALAITATLFSLLAIFFLRIVHGFIGRFRKEEIVDDGES